MQENLVNRMGIIQMTLFFRQKKTKKHLKFYKCDQDAMWFSVSVSVQLLAFQSFLLAHLTNTEYKSNKDGPDLQMSVVICSNSRDSKQMQGAKAKSCALLINYTFKISPACQGSFIWTDKALLLHWSCTAGCHEHNFLYNIHKIYTVFFFLTMFLVKMSQWGNFSFSTQVPGTQLWNHHDFKCAIHKKVRCKVAADVLSFMTWCPEVTWYL